MDKTVLKNFAIESRKDLMDKIDKKIKLFYIDEEFKKDNRGDVIVLSNDKHSLTLTKNEDENRDKLIRRIVELGYEQVVEEAAYTWFNRIIAIRYMEINDFLPLSDDNQSLGIRVLSSNDNEPIPEIMKFSNLTRKDLAIDFNLNKYNSLIREDEKFKYILLLVCKKLANLISPVFGGITDYIDLLIPDNMLLDNGFISNLLKNVSTSNFNEVEIIGWLYQYYNQTEKDRVMSENRAYKKNEIAYVTQLFTPDWIVRYLVDNTLGRFAIEHCNIDLSNELKYFDSNSKVNIQDDKKDIENIKFIDPCCGSGHILVYAFEVFYKMYNAIGYNKNDIVEKILSNNLYGLDIDNRAGQLSILSVLLKAREYDKKIFNKNIIKKINILSIEETNNINYGYLEYLTDDKIKKQICDLSNDFRNAKEIGSLLKVGEYDFDSIIDYLNSNNNIFVNDIRQIIVPVINAAKILRTKFDVYVTNPPYLNNDGMTDNLKMYLKDHYKESKMDLYSCFMDTDFINSDGLMGMINQHGWMFLSSFQGIREKILQNNSIITMCHLGPRAFEEIGGEVVQTTAFVISKDLRINDGSYYRLIGINNPKEKELKYLNVHNNKDIKYICNKDRFKRIPGSPVAYWVDDYIYTAFEKNKTLGELTTMFQGIITGNNNKFLRLWWEVDADRIAFDKEKMDFDLSKKKWIPYNKGGSFRKWYGNQDYVVDWSNGPTDKTRGKAGFSEYYLQKYVSWSYITTSTLAARFFPNGFLWDVAGSGFFCKNEDDLKYYQALLGSKIGVEILKIINPTMNYQVENVALLPIPEGESNTKKEIVSLVNNNINIAKEDWDSIETSWNFQGLEYINEGKLEDLINKYIEKSNENCKLLKENEKKINEIVFKLYNATYSSDDNYEVTYNKYDNKSLIINLISYAVGCMFGRYSLANDDNKSKYYDDDNIIPISDDESVYYNDDIVGKFKEFIKDAFGEKNLNTNISYIAEILGKRGTESSEDTIRRYFVNDFFSNHIKIYQKRPIYWEFDSGKKNGFKCLIYLHRYDEQLVSKIRTKYLHNTLSIYQRTVDEINFKLDNEELNITDKRNLQNKKADLNGKITECNEYEEMVGNVANKMIKLDLDDGVAINYAKFVDDNGKSILAKIK